MRLFARAIACLLLAHLPATHGTAAESVCHGTTRQGRLENGVKLPMQGNNFVTYGRLPALAGRTYVHSTVRDVIIEAYRMLEQKLPGKVYKYAETGVEDGGPFKPHKTHQNGLSVDFMVPVTDAHGRSVHLPTHPFNRFGYDIEFDTRGRFEQWTIDYTALAAHVVALHQAAEKHGIGIWRVIFDPQLVPYLLRTEYADYLKKHINIPMKASWVRHDEHYHVDFRVTCKDGT